MRRVLAFAIILGGFFTNGGEGYADDGRGWKYQHGTDYVILLRHALAPGTGDPDTFQVDDCTTQRNLSGEGRAQAVRIGTLIKKSGVGEVEVYSSQWCRCLETSRLLGLGQVKELPVLNSFYQRRENELQQTEGLIEWLTKTQPAKMRVLVTHQVNITALTGVYPTSGEMIFVQRNKIGNFEVTRRIGTN